MDRFKEEIAERFDLPALSVGVLKATLSGSRRVLVENHSGLLEYTTERVEVAGGKHRLRIWGAGLDIAAMDPDALLITGAITSLEIE